MSKTTTPQPEQLAAVRRAAKAGDLPRARERLAALRASFPGFIPLLGLAWEIDDLVGDAMRATASAYAWHTAAPGSRAALDALYQGATQTGLIALQVRAYKGLRALDGGKTLAPLPADVVPLDSLSPEEAEAIDVGRMHLGTNNPKAAAAVLRGVAHPAARNNLAVALFASGEVAAACEIVEANWHSEPANLFALERMVRWRCWTEGMERCLGFVAPLRHTQLGRPDDALAQVAALRFLDQAEAAQQAWKAAAQAPYWDQDAGGAKRAMFDALGGSPAASMAEPQMYNWFPLTWAEALSAVSQESRHGNTAAAQPRFEAVLDTCDAHADYLARALELGDAPVRRLALEMLKRRAQRGDAAARSALEHRLQRPAGTDTERMELLTWLLEKGLKKSGEPTEMWQDGSLREIKPTHLQIHGEPAPSPFPPEGERLNLRLILATRRGALKEAMELAQHLRRLYPKQPSPVANLAAIKEGLGHPSAEIIALYREAHALDPDYLFARCGLARQLAAQGQVAEARALIQGLENRPTMHYSDYRGILQTHRVLALAEGNSESVQAADEAMATLARQFER